MAEPGHLVSVHPEELKFQFELEKQSFCELKVTNNTEHCVAFKVKTTSPKKYFVRPNTGVIHPWDSSIIRVTLQAQKEYPPDMQCKDKFLLQSTIVASDADVDNLPQDTFNKDNGRTVEECKLRVIYQAAGNSEDEASKGSKQSLDSNTNQDLQRLKDERDSIVRKTQQLLQELEMLKRRRNRKRDAGFSFIFSVIVGLVGIFTGFLMKLAMASPVTE